MKELIFTYCSMHFEDEYNNTDVFWFGVDLAHLFVIQAVQWKYCPIEGNSDDANFRFKSRGVC